MSARDQGGSSREDYERDAERRRRIVGRLVSDEAIIRDALNRYDDRYDGSELAGRAKAALEALDRLTASTTSEAPVPGASGTAACLTGDAATIRAALEDIRGNAYLVGIGELTGQAACEAIQAATDPISAAIGRIAGASGTAAKERELERRRDALVAESGTVASLTKALRDHQASVGRLEEALRATLARATPGPGESYLVPDDAIAGLRAALAGGTPPPGEQDTGEAGDAGGVRAEASEPSGDSVTAEVRAAIEACPTPVYHETHRYCPSCPWNERLAL